MFYCLDKKCGMERVSDVCSWIRRIECEKQYEDLLGCDYLNDKRMEKGVHRQYD